MNGRARAVRVVRTGLAAACLAVAMLMVAAPRGQAACVGTTCVSTSGTSSGGIKLPLLSPTASPTPITLPGVCLPPLVCTSPTTLATPTVPPILSPPPTLLPTLQPTSGPGRSRGGSSTPGGTSSGSPGVPLPPGGGQGGGGSSSSQAALNLGPPPAITQLGAVSGLTFGKAPVLVPILVILDLGALAAAAVVVRRTWRRTAL